MKGRTRLQEVYFALIQEGGELVDEGVSPHEYWLIRAGIDMDDFHAFCEHVISEYSSSDDEVQVRMHIAVGFLVGLQYGREKPDDEL